MIDISIIIVNYNSFSLLKECVNSIINFTDRNISYEIIIVDNNSTQGDITKHLDTELGVKFLLNKKNMGFAAANNQAIEIAKGKYILFLNNDTLFIEDTISKIFLFLNHLNEDVIVGCRLLNGDETHQASVVDMDSLTNSFGENFFLYLLFKNVRALNKYYFSNNEPKLPTKVDIIKGAFIFCSKKLVNELKGFDERFFFYAEETDFCIRAKNKGFKVYYFPDTKIIHFGGVASEAMPWFKYKNQTIAKIQIYQKHYKSFEYFFLVFFHLVGISIRIPVYLLFGVLSINKSMIQKSFLYFRQLFIFPTNKFNKK